MVEGLTYLRDVYLRYDAVGHSRLLAEVPPRAEEAIEDDIEGKRIGEDDAPQRGGRLRLRRGLNRKEVPVGADMAIGSSREVDGLTTSLKS